MHMRSRWAGCRQVFSEGKFADLNLRGGVQIKSVDQMGNALAEREDQAQNYNVKQNVTMWKT